MSAAIRAQLDAIRSICNGIEASLPDDAQAADDLGPCEHPEDKRRDMTTMGEGKRYMCGVCGDVVAE